MKKKLTRSEDYGIRLARVNIKETAINNLMWLQCDKSQHIKNLENVLKQIETNKARIATLNYNAESIEPDEDGGRTTQIYKLKKSLVSENYKLVECATLEYFRIEEINNSEVDWKKERALIIEVDIINNRYTNIIGYSYSYEEFCTFLIGINAYKGGRFYSSHTSWGDIPTRITFPNGKRYFIEIDTIKDL